MYYLQRLSLLSCVAVVLFFAPAANAAVESIVEQNLGSISEHLARGGASSVPGTSCGSRCADFLVEEHKPISGQLSSEQIHRELRTVRSGVRVLPALRVLGTVSLGPAAFELGWKVGSGINAKLLRIGVPADPAGDGDGISPDGPLQLLFRAEGEYLNYLAAFPSAYGSTAGDALQPEDGWTLVTQNHNQGWTRSGVTGGPNPGCWRPTLSSSIEGYERGPLGGYQSCFNGYYQPRTEYQFLGLYKPEHSLRAAAPVEDYVNQPYERQTPTWSDQPQSQADLEQRTRAALDTGEYPLLDAWYSHQLDPQNYEDPRDDEEQPDDCDPEDSARAGDPGQERGTGDFLQDANQWRARYETVPGDRFGSGGPVPPGGLPAVGGTAYMRWGFTKPTANPKIRWRGWGYRKIRAKHGWGPTALRLTEAALLTTPTRTQEYDEYTSLSVDRFPNRAGGKVCEWRVAVQRDPYENANNPEVSQSAPMNGIITAYGRYVGAG